MYERIDPRAVLRLFRKPLPAPVDVLNLIRFADREQYRWYGLFVTPTILGVGGGMLWAGRWEAAVAGEAQAEELLVVRYPSHRRFLAMTMSPYYAAINGFRERGVERFQASFTHASRSSDALRRQKRLLVLHYNSPAGDDLRLSLEALLTAAGLEAVYASSEVSPIDVFREYVASDPNPLSYKSVIFSAIPESMHPGAELVESLQRLAPGLSLQIYARESLSSLMPAAAAPFVRRLMPKRR